MSLGNYLKAKDLWGRLNLLKMIYITFFLLYIQSFSFLQGQVYQPMSYSSETSCCEESPNQFFVRADFLYWKPQISGLDLAFGTGSITQSITDVSVTYTMQESDIDAHFKWNPGYRIAAGYLFPCQDWEVDAWYTHFQSKGKRTAHGLDSIVNSGTSRVNFDQVDVVLAYNSSWCSLTVKPFLGVRLARIHENINTVLTTELTILPATIGAATRTFDDHQHSKVVGPLLGFHGDWEIGEGFGIYGTAAASVLYGYHRVNLNDSEVVTVPILSQVFSANSRKLHRFNCNVDLALGVRWNTCFWDSFDLGVKVGFEHHEYFNHSLLGTERGDLSFDGAIVAVIVGF